MRKIIFLWHIIFLPDCNVYRRIAMHIISCVGPNMPEFSKSPISEMYRSAWRYGLGLDIWEAFLHGPSGTFHSRKKATKQLVWDFENRLWRCTTVMYKNLDFYIHSIEKIQILSWWKYVRKKPAKTKQARCTVAVLLGSQPKAMQCNFSGICSLCDERQAETPVHILLFCNHYDHLRTAHMNSMKNHMPQAMRREFENMSPHRKCQFMLSGLNNSYVDEWDCIYSDVVDFVWQMYMYRHQSYGSE